MLTRLHARATATSAVRAALQLSSECPAVLAARHGIAWTTARKWQDRGRSLDGARAVGEVHDRSHTAHRLQITLSEAQGALVVYMRQSLQLPLDNLVAVTREFISPKASRSALDRLLRRYGESKLRPVIAAPVAPTKTFTTYEPGYVHVDIKYLPKLADQTQREYLYVAIGHF